MPDSTLTKRSVALWRVTRVETACAVCLIDCGISSPPLEPARPEAHISARTYTKERGTPLSVSSASFPMNAW
jgi:hypothetical protein